MKTVVKLLTLVFLLSSAAAYASPVDPAAAVKAVASKEENTFAFKVDRKFRKALIEIYSSDGELLAVTAMGKRKMVINFSDVKSGTYTIKVKKNNLVEQFQFKKK